MYKVLIADDETPIRDWLEICVNNTGCECEVVAKASNGRIALEQYQKEQPDIIITDIKMPFMDGIDLIARIREQNKEIPVVILTSYKEFSFARQALQQGVTEYVLKTEVTVERMKEILTKIIRALEKKSPQNKGEHYQLERRRVRFLQKCAEENKNWRKEEAEAEWKTLGIPLSEVNMAAIAFSDAEGSILIADQFSDVKIVAVLPFRDDISLILCNVLGQVSQNRQREALYRMAAYILEFTGLSVGVSDIYSGFSYLPHLLKESIERLSQSFYDKKPSVHELETFHCDSGVIAGIRELQQSFETSVRDSEYESCRDKMLEIMQEMRLQKLPDIPLVRSICSSLLKYFYYSYAPESGEKLAYMEYIMAKIEKSRTIYEIEQFVCQSVGQLQESYGEDKVQYSVPVQRSIDYLQENYQETLTLPVVSAYIGFSPDYFSRIFKEETGINFSTYLTKFRLKEALKLLRTTNMKVYEVSIAVGYSNMSYFSTVFKKEYGINPFDFKNSSKPEQNAVLASVKKSTFM